VKIGGFFQLFSGADDPKLMSACLALNPKLLNDISLSTHFHEDGDAKRLLFR
jgi:hypothetical protein